MRKKFFYAVFLGRKPGIYLTWKEAKTQVDGFSNPRYKGFTTLKEAEEWIINQKKEYSYKKKKSSDKEIKKQIINKIERPTGDNIIMYTDGACKNNPGPGGYGILILYKEKQKEIYEGFRLTTNNRMELLACIIGLETIKNKRVIDIYSDSAYVVNSVNKGWVERWKSNGWKRNKYDFADNVDLWERFLDIYKQHIVTMNWVKGHSNNPGNKRCDELAGKAAEGIDLKIDYNYEEKLKK